MESRKADLEAGLTGKKRMPYLFMKKPAADDSNTRLYDTKTTEVYFNTLEKMAKEGVSYAGKTYLVTGAGPGSIAVETVKSLLAGGAKVVVTSSSLDNRRADFYQKLYEQYGAKGSELITLPMNQGSVQDVDALVKYIYEPQKEDGSGGLGLDLDGIIPFAAINQEGKDISKIDSKSELAQRIMLTNLLRLLGSVKTKKAELGINTKPAQVVLPLSPNHGAFGYDGLYAESKIGLEPLLHKWKSEGWGDYLNMVGAVIGWTRGTNLMAVNDNVAPGIEKLGARTFSQPEMTFNIMGLLHPDMVEAASRHPVWADLNGGFNAIQDLNEATAHLRKEIESEASIKKAVAADAKLDEEALGIKQEDPAKITPKANFEVPFPQLPSTERLEALRKDLGGVVDPSKVVVVAGFGEVGPFGGARARWEMEAHGKLSLEGLIETAWMMGLIKYHNGPGKDGKPYSGWVDAKSGEAVPDHEVRNNYEKYILDHVGVREMEPAMMNGYDPHNKEFYSEVVLKRDGHRFDARDEEHARSIQQKHGDKAEVIKEGEQWYVQLKKGAVIRVPRAEDFNRFVAGQIPTGWDPRRYGIPDKIAKQIDPVSLYNLVATAEALLRAGIIDPYELYSHVHVSEVGNAIGGGMGGMKNIRAGFQDRAMEKPVAPDNLQEQLINVVAAWVNMLVLGSSGPLVSTVGACAQTAQSVEVGTQMIQSGKAKIVIVGGVDDLSEEGSHEFASMQATSNSKKEKEAGRDPKEMSRPMTKTRPGFMESQGATIKILMAGDVALQAGAPIHSVVAMVHTASDGQGDSVPAPGKGVLTVAKEAKGPTSPLLDLKLRRRVLENKMKDIQDRKVKEEKRVERKRKNIIKREGKVAGEARIAAMKAHIEDQVRRDEQAVLSVYGNNFYKDDPTISPLRGALAVFGLTPDDIGVVSFHGTSTKANDKNESSVVNKIMKSLGRALGNLLPVISQKWLTGHPKGAAAGWMMNGLIQAMETGIVPGNRNADNIDPELRENEHLVYPNQSIQMNGPIEAGLMQSFGFGQAGAAILLVHPDRFLATLKPEALADYTARRALRQTAATRHYQNALTGKDPWITPKTEAPYTKEELERILLDPEARAKQYPDPQRPGRYVWRFSPPPKPEDDKKKKKAQAEAN
ncbi:MAG TPA: hypothetical protein DF383_09680 [Deltaproteobacteria bacterium]|nr:hypothetical protein [Deltaproteobacteria bacterium]